MPHFTPISYVHINTTLIVTPYGRLRKHSFLSDTLLKRLSTTICSWRCDKRICQVGCRWWGIFPFLLMKTHVQRSWIASISRTLLKCCFYCWVSFFVGFEFVSEIQVVVIQLLQLLSHRWIFHLLRGQSINYTESSSTDGSIVWICASPGYYGISLILCHGSRTWDQGTGYRPALAGAWPHRGTQHRRTDQRASTWPHHVRVAGQV